MSAGKSHGSSRYAVRLTVAPVLAALLAAGCSPAQDPGRPTAPTPSPDGTVTSDGTATTPDPTTDTGGTTSGPGAAAYPPAVEDEALVELVRAMDEALAAEDLDAFLAHVGPGLREQQRAWFEAVVNVPMEVRQLRPDRVVSRRSPEGTVLHVGLRHRITGGDPQPLMQQYRWVVAPGDDGRPLLVRAEGRNGQLYGNPQLWDIGPVAALEGDGVLVLALEETRADAEALLPELEAAAQEVLRDFPALGEGREVLAVQLFPGEVLADALGFDYEEGFTSGMLWLHTAVEEPDPGRLDLGREGPLLAPRIMIDVDWAATVLAEWGAAMRGDQDVRYFGAAVAVQGADPDHYPVEWVSMGVPGWYASLGDDAGAADLRGWVAETHASLGTPEALPSIATTTVADPLEVEALATSFVLYLDDTFGSGKVLELANAMVPLDGWYDDPRISGTLTSTLGASEEELLTGWQAWVEELLAIWEQEGPASESGR